MNNDIQTITRILAESKSIYDSSMKKEDILEAFLLYCHALHVTEKSELPMSFCYHIARGLHDASPTTWEGTMCEICTSARQALLDICSKYE